MSVTKLLWYLYGYLYDGLRAFYPYQLLTRTTVDWLDIQSGQAVLDLGCGTGNVLELVLATPGSTATGIDLSASMLAVARRKLQAPLAAHRLVLHQGNLADLLATLPDASFDRLVSVNVLYALDESARAIVWRHAYRVLRPGGRFIMNTAVQTGSGVIIREHLAHRPWWTLLRPRLVGVFLVDALIDLFGHTGRFAFPSPSVLRTEAETAGFHWRRDARCYGGPHHGVNVLAELTKD